MEDNSPINKRTNVFINHPWVVALLTTIFGIIISSNLIGLTSKVQAAINDINNIKSIAINLSKSLEPDIRGGQDVFVGLNTRELKHNEIYVFSDNTYNISTGSEIYLTNHLDDRYQTTIKCIVIRTPNRNSDNSKASIFISLEAAKRLGLLDINQKWQGIYHLKLTRKISNDPKTSS